MRTYAIALSSGKSLSLNAVLLNNNTSVMRYEAYDKNLGGLILLPQNEANRLCTNRFCVCLQRGRSVILTTSPSIR